MKLGLSFALMTCLTASALAEPVTAPGAAPTSAPVVTLPMEVPTNSPDLYYVGRLDVRDGTGPRMQWSAGALKVHFKGTALQVKLNDSGKNYYAVTIDQQPPTVIHPAKGESVVDLAKDLPAGEHLVSMVRRTEAFGGITQFRGIYLSEGGTLLPPERLKRRIEVIGDSISCGYGNESKSEKEHFAMDTENAAMTYGAVAARAVQADYDCIAWSGRKMWPDNTIPEIYDLTLPGDKTAKWDFAKDAPDVIVVNLSTNDFHKAAPDEEKWTAAYEKFLAHLRDVSPQGTIYITTSPMLGGEKAKTLAGYLEHIKKDMETAGDKKLHVLVFPTQNGGKDGLGGDYHPNLKTHQKMAEILEAALKTDLGWDAAPAAAPAKP